MKRKKILLVVLSFIVAFVSKTTFAIRFSDGFVALFLLTRFSFGYCTQLPI